MGHRGILDGLASFEVIHEVLDRNTRIHKDEYAAGTRQAADIESAARCVRS
jgi:hypothetical protein